MSEPLTKSQQGLRGRKLCDMTNEQLREWIDACNRMEQWVKPAKSRRAWREMGIKAEAELDRRLEQSDH